MGKKKTETAKEKTAVENENKEAQKVEVLDLAGKVKELKKNNQNLAGSNRLSFEGRKSRALKALIGAMERRAWTKKEQGVYHLAGVFVDTRTPKDVFGVVILDSRKEEPAPYKLGLGKGAIRELDSFMRWS